MAKSLTPLHDRVVIRRITEVESVRGGITIPDTAKEKPQEGVVVAVGTGKFEKGQTVPLAVKAGDHVLFGKYAGTEIKLDAEELLIVREEEILGILNGAGSQIKAVKK
jgi:chaperonin GroES